MRKIPIFAVDAFARNCFSGNPASVCPLEEWLPDDVLQSIAAENNLSETAFLVRTGDAFEIRWFTPKIEVDLCGHATLAAAHVLVHHLGHTENTVRFDSQIGRLFVRRVGNRLILDFPAHAAEPCKPPPSLVAGLGVKPVETLKARDYLAVLESEEAVRDLKPDYDALKQLDCLGIIATARGSKCDFVSRFFSPRSGVYEDPVTGSAHCALIPYWARKLGHNRLHAYQISRRGGELFCENLRERVKIGGYAVTYLTGEISI